ncbi:uncharacterized protein N7483_007372 [Penicillium malachiteum]|uniref:uncharacterized protein n=1 Tax=Penicillium malachiteum TaxID=1324776 RepID=UPI002548D349|nr:uncharacterized protein N7483_007372 [Penicillium malachiteum]KAJ5726015.1 hypothetical protein N7483_007372 [Penicillium malachiteum]
MDAQTEFTHSYTSALPNIIYHVRATAIETSSNKDHYEKVLTAPLDYLRDIPGKGIRSQLIDAFNEFLRVPSDKLDVLRRGAPAAHHIFRVSQTTNSANHGYFVAQRELTNLLSPHAFSIFIDELINLHRGQGMELYWRDSLQSPCEEEYIQMVLEKTGGFFSSRSPMDVS